MMRHYCDKEKQWLNFNDQCTWCGMTEKQARNYENLSGDALFQEIRARVSQHDDGHITDD